MSDPSAPTVTAIAPGAFRKVMGHFVTGITVVTTLQGGRPRGITVNALTSVSLDPPLVVVALDRRRFITPSVHETGRYAVNVLSEDQQALSDCFAGAAVEPSRDDFCGASWTPGPTGLPLLDGAIATLECTVTETFQAGDHELFVARVDSLGNAEPHPMPLLYYRRQYLKIQRSESAPLEGVPEHVTGPITTGDEPGEA
ncbi:MAG TPA: flavin reductase family protein [Candidatus Limnocylindrales bacterium]|nr:flavin reductase family protein [Candidatus Limnocylindrales bacterium]